MTQVLNYRNFHLEIRYSFYYPNRAPNPLGKNILRSHGKSEKLTMRSDEQLKAMHFKYSI